jgi:hypothetical protein
MTATNIFQFYNYNNTLVTLNKSKILEQRLSNLEIVKIREIHELKNYFIKKISKTNNRDLLKILGQLITLLELKLQESWGFDKCILYHRFWELPKCQCPQMDNNDRLCYCISEAVDVGAIISDDCPLHGTKK